jgi:hypothetical protein
MVRFVITAALFTFLIAPKGITQHWQGIALGNYSGTNALYHNPALVADSRYSVYGNLAGIQYFVGNNHVKWDAPFSFASLISNTVSDEHRNENGKVSFPRRYLDQRLNGNLKYINTGLDLRLPSLMVSLKDGKYGVAFTTRARGLMNVSETTEPLAQLIRGSTQDTTLHGTKFTNQSGKLLLNGFVEYAVTLGGVLLDDETDFFKVGITAKRLVGVAQNRIDIRHADYELIPDPEWNNLRYMTAISSINGTTQYTTDDGMRSASLNPNWWLLGKTAPGSGWGLDIGAVYEYRPDINRFKNFGKAAGAPKRDPSVNKYLYRLAVSLTDFGVVNYHNDYYNYAQTAENAAGNLNYNSFNPWTGVDNFFGAIERTLGVPAATPSKRKTRLPMALQSSIDYQLKPNVYVTALWVAPLTRAGSPNMRQESLLSLVPRYERRWFEVSVPISIMNHYRSFGVGLAGRAGPLWFGADHLTGLFNIGNPKAMSIYAGISMGIFRKSLTDEIPCWPPRQSFFKRIFKEK